MLISYQLVSTVLFLMTDSTLVLALESEKRAISKGGVQSIYYMSFAFSLVQIWILSSMGLFPSKALFVITPTLLFISTQHFFNKIDFDGIHLPGFPHVTYA